MTYEFKNDARFKDIDILNKRIWLASPTMHGDEERYVHEAFDSG